MLLLFSSLAVPPYVGLFSRATFADVVNSEYRAGVQ